MECPTCAQVRAIMNIPRPSTPVDEAVDEFIRLHCIVNPGETVTAKGLYAAYYGWAAANGHQVLSVNKFGMMLTARGFRGRRGYGGERWRDGITLRNPSLHGPVYAPSLAVHQGDPSNCRAVDVDPYADVFLD